MLEKVFGNTLINFWNPNKVSLNSMMNSLNHLQAENHFKFGGDL
jgi:hypothetical protein